MHEWTVPLDEFSKGGFGQLVRPSEEPFQELLVGEHHDRVSFLMCED